MDVRRVGAIFWIEALLGTTSAVLTILTLVNRAWIEAVLGVEPDGGNGMLEVLIVVAFVGATITFSMLARNELRRSAHRLR